MGHIVEYSSSTSSVWSSDVNVTSSVYAFRIYPSLTHSSTYCTIITHSSTYCASLAHYYFFLLCNTLFHIRSPGQPCGIIHNIIHDHVLLYCYSYVCSVNVHLPPCIIYFYKRMSVIQRWRPDPRGYPHSTFLDDACMVWNCHRLLWVSHKCSPLKRISVYP